MRRMQWLAIMTALIAGMTNPASAVTILFDGGEAGVLPNTTLDFSFGGSNWVGGEARAGIDLALYKSAPGAYLFTGDGARQITFDQGVTSVTMVFMHGGSFQGGFAEATATAYGAGDVVIETLDSVVAAASSTPFVSFATDQAILRIEFSGGVVDNFAYEAAPVPEPGVALLLGTALLTGLGRRR